MKTIASFGDSFVFGTELANNDDGSQAWPSLIAKELGCNYHTSAVAGCGNDHIARQIYSWFANNPVEDTLAVINWTWTSRWDFYIVDHEQWITLGPTCVPEKLQSLVDKTQSHRIVEFYHDYANGSLLWNKFRNLQTIYAVQTYMKSRGIKSIQTYMDYELFATTWHAPDYVRVLQDLVKPEMQLFDDKNFVDWSKSKGFVVTEEGNHPLEPAHYAAAEHWKDVYYKSLF